MQNSKEVTDCTHHKDGTARMLIRQSPIKLYANRATVWVCDIITISLARLARGFFSFLEQVVRNYASLDEDVVFEGIFLADEFSVSVSQSK